MIVNAALCFPDIVEQARLHSHLPKYQYFSPLVNYEPMYDINKYQFGIYSGSVLCGYIEARIDGRIIRDVSVISWREGAIVMRDVIRFVLSCVDERGYAKVVYACVFNNPIYETLDKLGKYYGSRYVGTFCAERLAGGRYRDVVYWELHRNEYMRRKAMRKIGSMI